MAYSYLLELEPDDPQSLNSCAWLLVTCQDPKLQHPERAVKFASKAVKLAPADGNIWNTLGVAQYRAGHWKAAIEALDKSMELRDGGDSMDWFFLAMSEWQLGNQDAALEWYEKAVKWMEERQPTNEELIRFRTEAAQLLGITDPRLQTIDGERKSNFNRVP